MRKFAFTLQRMLAFKQTMYEKERNALAQLRAERLAIQARRDNTENQMLARDAAFREKAARDGVGVDEVTALSFHRDNADKLVKQLEDETARKDVEIGLQLQVVVALDREVKSLDKLREKQWEEYQAEAAAEERDRILELVSRKFRDGQVQGRQEEQAARPARRHAAS